MKLELTNKISAMLRTNIIYGRKLISFDSKEISFFFDFELSFNRSFAKILRYRKRRHSYLN